MQSAEGRININGDSLSHEEIIKLIGDRGVDAYDEMARQFPGVFQEIPPESFLSIYNAAFLIGFRNAELMYKARMLEVALDMDAEENAGG